MHLKHHQSLLTDLEESILPHKCAHIELDRRVVLAFVKDSLQKYNTLLFGSIADCVRDASE